MQYIFEKKSPFSNFFCEKATPFFANSENTSFFLSKSLFFSQMLKNRHCAPNDAKEKKKWQKIRRQAPLP